MNANLILSVCGNRETIEIAANSDYEIVFNEIDNALRKLYQISNGRRRYGNQSLIFKASVGKNNLIFGIGLSADKSGKIIWEYNIDFDRIDRGASNYSRYVNGAFWYMANMIISRFSLTDEIGEENNETDDFEALNAEEEEDKIEIQTEGMYEYAQEAYIDIEAYAEDAVCLYRDIERTLEDPDYGDLEDYVIQLWKRLEDIHNTFGICLDRCNYLTGCDITFDDFCGTDYFSDIEVPGYMGWDLEDLMYDGDPTNVLENILDNICRENPEYIDTLSAAIDGTGLYLAA